MLLAQKAIAQIITYEGKVSLKNTIPASNDINHALIFEMIPEFIYEQKVVITTKKFAYSYSAPVAKQKENTIKKEGNYKWINYDAGFTYAHKQGNFSPPALDIVATNETKIICGYVCKMYYHIYDYKGKTDTCFFWITDKLPDKISPGGLFNNNQKIKGAVLAEKSSFSTWEAISVEKCDKIDKKLFDWSLHPNNVNSEQLKKYVPCKF